MTSEKRVLHGLEGLEAAVGHELGVSGWLTVDQRMIDDFGRITGDQQWIHTDIERAASSRFGTTIAHGFLVLALIPVLANQVYEIQGFSARMNYGLEKVRFPQPLPSGARVRNRVSIARVEQVPSGTRVTFSHRIECESEERPVCVAQTIVLFTS